MAASSTTRRGKGGKGDGWGGAASGVDSNSKAGIAGPGRPDRETAEQIATRRAERAEALLDHIDFLATNADRQETQLSAAAAYVDRVKGKPVARNEHSAPGGGPMVVEWVIVDPKGSVE